MRRETSGRWGAVRRQSSRVVRGVVLDSAAATMTAGCFGAPSMRTFLREHRLQSAARLARDPDTSVEDTRLAQRVIEEEVAPSLHLSAANESQVRLALGNRYGAELMKKVSIVRILHDYSRSNLSWVKLSVAFVDSQGDELPVTGVNDQRKLAVLLDPSQANNHDRHVTDAGAVAANAIVGVFDPTNWARVLTLGVWQPKSRIRYQSTTRKVPAKPLPAPLAAAVKTLDQSVQTQMRTDHLSRNQSADIVLVALPRATSRHLRSVHLRWSFGGAVYRDIELPLPRGRDLSARLHALFGDRMVPLSELVRMGEVVRDTILQSTSAGH